MTVFRDYEICVGIETYRVEDVEIDAWEESIGAHTVSGHLVILGWGKVEKDYPDPVDGSVLWVETCLVDGPTRDRIQAELYWCTVNCEADGVLARECRERGSDDETNRTLANRKEDVTR